jgi:putative transposase
MLRDRALELLGITKHAYYYQPKEGKRGRNKSHYTTKITCKNRLNTRIDTDQLVKEIIAVKSNPETDYGYRAMTAALQLKGYVINKKKVYPIMGDYQLLHEKRKKTGKVYVKHRRVDPRVPLEVIEMDIKFQWVVSHQRYAFILTIIDCFTRTVLHWQVAYSITQSQVIDAWEDVIVNYLQPYRMMDKKITIEIRNDNDSRFAAHSVQKYLAENGLNQVFTHPYTPEENGHIESFHSILGRSLERIGTFRTLQDLEQHLKGFYTIYNEVRLHGSLDHLPPKRFWKLWQEGLIESIVRKNKARRHRLLIPHYELSGNGSQKEHSARPLGRIKNTATVAAV